MKNLSIFFVLFFALVISSAAQTSVGTHSSVPNFNSKITTIEEAPVSTSFEKWVAEENSAKLVQFANSDLFRNIESGLSGKAIGSHDEIVAAFKELPTATPGEKIGLDFGTWSENIPADYSNNFIYIMVPINGIYVDGYSDRNGYIAKKAKFNLFSSGLLILDRTTKKIVFFSPLGCGNLASIAYLTVLNYSPAKPDTVKVGGDTYNIDIDIHVDSCCDDTPASGPGLFDHFKAEVDWKGQVGLFDPKEIAVPAGSEAYKLGVKINSVFGQLMMTSSAEGLLRIGFSRNGSAIDQWFNNGMLSWDLTSYGNDPFWIAVEEADGTVHYEEFRISQFQTDGTEIIRQWSKGLSEMMDFETTIWIEFGPRLKMSFDPKYRPDWFVIVGIGLYGGLNTGEPTSLSFGGGYAELGCEIYGWQLTGKVLSPSSKTSNPLFHVERGFGGDLAIPVAKTWSIGLGYTNLSFPTFDQHVIGVTVVF